jgi:transposase-like protein
MRVRLKNKILLWKTNALGRTIYLRTLQAQLKRRDLRIANLELEVARLKQITQPVVVANHIYPAQLIALAVFIVVHGKGSLRCAEKTVGYVSQMMGWEYAQPSHTTVRHWVLRCGLYLLEHTKAKSGTYVAIIDESIQVGKEKLLLLLGVKLSEDHSHSAPLTMAETEVLGMEVQQSWNSQEIADFITQRLGHHKDIVIKYIISDRGTNLLAALRILDITHVSDCSHMLMNAIKKLFCDDKALSKLCSQISQLRQYYLLTDLGFLLPPTLRNKDRFLQIFTLVDWADRIDSYWNNLSRTQRRPLGFLKQFEPLLRCLRQVRDLIAMTAKILKSAGLSPISRQLWESNLSQYRKGKKMTKQALALIESIRSYFDQHQQLILDHQRLLCCSDVIESSFGHYKNKGGMAVISADVLGLTLLRQPITCSFIQEALATVHRQDVEIWQQRFTCDNRYSLLRRMNQELKTVA